MKTTAILFLIPALSLVSAVSRATTFEIPVELTVGTQITPNGDSSQVTLKNNSPEPLICDQLDVSVSLIEGEFNQKIGEIHPRFRNVFVRAGQTLIENEIGVDEIHQLKDQGRTARISSISPKLGSCRIAELEDYCSHGDLSAEEKKTVDALNRHYGVRSCSDWNPESQTTLHLSRKGLTDLSPLAYFRNLQVLTIHRNSVSDLSPLSRLFKLREIHAEGNPIESVDAIRELPKLGVACVGSTPFAAKGPVAKPFYSSCRHR